MKESIWLQKYEKEVGGKRAKSNQNKKVIFIIIPMMLLLFLVAAIANGGAMDPQARMGMLFMVGVFVFIMVFVIIMVGKGKKVDAAKGTRENVKLLLKTDEEVDYFDQQMNSAPIMEEKIALGSTVFLTMDYVGITYLFLGDLQYRFARKGDIASLHYSKTKSTGANPLRASYFFDVKNANNEVLLHGIAETGEQLGKMEAILKTAQPNLAVVNKKGF